MESCGKRGGGQWEWTSGTSWWVIGPYPGSVDSDGYIYNLCLFPIVHPSCRCCETGPGWAGCDRWSCRYSPPPGEELAWALPGFHGIYYQWVRYQGRAVCYSCLWWIGFTEGDVASVSVWDTVVLSSLGASCLIDCRLPLVKYVSKDWRILLKKCRLPMSFILEYTSCILGYRNIILKYS